MKRNFKIHITQSAQKELGTLPREDYFKVKKAILRLGSNPRPRGAKKFEAERVGGADVAIIVSSTKYTKSD